MERKSSKNIYRLPFDEKLNLKPEPAPFHYELNGGWGKNAVDFAMPIGTPIMAALDGIVVEAIDEYTQRGADESFLGRSNSVTIQHVNNEYSEYCHLKKDSLKVKEGEKVKEGQIIAYSGDTGLTTYPHLHFHVLNEEQETIVIRFKIKGGVVFLRSPKS